MFAAHKKSNVLIVEMVIFWMISALFFREIMISLLAAVPSGYIALVLSAIILLSMSLLVFDHICKMSILPRTIYCLSLFLLALLCIATEPTYLPQWVKGIAVLVCLLSSIRVIQGIWTQRRWHFVYQFELIGKVKMQLVVLQLVILLDVVNAAGYNPVYYLVALPVLLMIILALKFDSRKMPAKLLGLLYTAALLSICTFTYMEWANFFAYFSFLLPLPICFYLFKHLYKRKTVFLLSLIVAYNELFIYLRIFNFLSDTIGRAVSLIGLGLNIIAVVAIFVKVKQKAVRQLLSPFIGVYTLQNIIEQVIGYADQKESADELFGSSVVQSMEYAGLKEIDGKTFDDIKDRAVQSDNMFTTIYLRKLPKFFDWLRSLFWFVRTHWRAPVAVIILVMYLPINYAGIHGALSRFLAERGKISTVLETAYYAHDYMVFELDKLSDGVDISGIESFSHYIARVFENRADEYFDAGKTELQIKALSLSLRFEYDYTALLSRLRAHDAANNYLKTIEDIDALLLFEEGREDREYWLDYKCTLGLYYGYVGPALADAEVLCAEYPSVENDALVGACMIGTGNIDEAVQILNSCIDKQADLPYWVYRMRGIAYLALTENGEDCIEKAKTDIQFAYNGDSSRNNSLAYARLCIYLGDSSLALSLIEEVIQAEEDYARAYYWLSQYYSSMGDKENERVALNRSRDLQYVGNGEY